MNILVFIKSMPYATPAVLFAGLIARLTGGRVTLLKSSLKNKTSSNSTAELEQAAALLPDIEVEIRTGTGKEARSILEDVAVNDYDLVVMRARRAIRYRNRLGAKLGRLVAIESPIPVLIVKGDHQPPALRKILICTGGQGGANPVIEIGAELAKASGAEITLLHVTNPVPSMYTGMYGIEETMTELLQTDTPTARHLRSAAAYLAGQEIQANLEIRQGDVKEEILAEAAEGGYDLVLIGAASRDNRLKEWIMGDVTRSLVNHAAAAVLVVR